MTQKQKEKTFTKTFQKITTKFTPWTLSQFKNEIIDDKDKNYFVDLDIQRNPYFTQRCDRLYTILFCRSFFK